MNASAMVGLAPFSLGLAIAFVSGFGALYLHSAAVYLGAVGVGWVTFWVASSDQRLAETLGPASDFQLVGAFQDPASSQAHIDAARAFIYSKRLTVVCSAVALVGFWSYLYWAQFRRHELTSFPHWWAAGPHLVPKFLVLVVFSIPTTVLVTTAVIGILGYGRLVRRLSKLEVRLPLEFTRLCLRPLVSWGLYAALGWSLGGPLLVALLLRLHVHRPAHSLRLHFLPTHSWDPKVAGGAVFIAELLLALILFAYPQVSFHMAMVRARDRVAREAISDISSRWPSLGPGEYYRLIRDRSEGLSGEGALLRLPDMPVWVHLTDGIVLFFAQSVVPIASFFLLVR
jgi:hypothetical protein